MATQCYVYTAKKETKAAETLLKISLEVVSQG